MGVGQKRRRIAGDCISSAQLKALQQTDGRDRDGK